MWNTSPWNNRGSEEAFILFQWCMWIPYGRKTRASKPTEVARVRVCQESLFIAERPVQYSPRCSSKNTVKRAYPGPRDPCNQALQVWRNLKGHEREPTKVPRETSCNQAFDLARVEREREPTQDQFLQLSSHRYSSIARQVNFRLVT